MLHTACMKDYIAGGAEALVQGILTHMHRDLSIVEGLMLLQGPSSGSSPQQTPCVAAYEGATSGSSPSNCGGNTNSSPPGEAELLSFHGWLAECRCLPCRCHMHELCGS